MPEPEPDPPPRGGAACRDCDARPGAPAAACPACGSPRIVAHPRLFALPIAHVDCDAFFAAIEKRDNPELAARPVIVGGGNRGVVSTCCYIARTYGVRSAMPMFKALKACPDAVVIRGRMDVYAAEGRRIRAMLRELTPLVEPVSVDEAYLDLSGTEALHGAPPAILLMRLQRRVERELGLTISVGLSSNPFLAKIASEADKPRGFFVLDEAEAPEWLAARPVSIIRGVGAAGAARLKREGMRTVGDLQRLGPERLRARLGEHGLWLHARAMGRDDRRIDPSAVRKSISSETTLAEDVADHRVLEDVLWELCERAADRAKAVGLAGHVVTLKLKTAAFEVRTRRASLAAPTQLAQALFRTARALLAREAHGPRYRLIGVGLSDLSEAGADAADLADLADPAALKRAHAERAADRARSRFGPGVVTTGRGLSAAARRRGARAHDKPAADR